MSPVRVGRFGTLIVNVRLAWSSLATVTEVTSGADASSPVESWNVALLVAAAPCALRPSLAATSSASAALRRTSAVPSLRPDPRVRGTGRTLLALRRVSNSPAAIPLTPLSARHLPLLSSIRTSSHETSVG